MNNTNPTTDIEESLLSSRKAGNTLIHVKKSTTASSDAASHSSYSTKPNTPDKMNGYSESVSITTMNRLDPLFRFVWEKRQRYITKIDVSHANSWCKDIAKRDDLSENTR
jgi:hypothetical protein